MRGEEAADLAEAKTTETNTRLSFISQTMSFIRLVLEALEKPDKPFIYDVNATRPEGGCELVSLAIAVLKTEARMVEPDGIEPTTSCLQSTRSTN